MPTQSFNLNLKAHDQGWEGKQVAVYNCAECGTDSSGAQAHSNWHDNLTNTLQQLNTAIQQVNATAQQALSVGQQAQTLAQQAYALAQQAMNRP